MARVQTQDFDMQVEIQKLREGSGLSDDLYSETGAIVSFTGIVRDFLTTERANTNKKLFLEHYPGMTERVLNDIEQQALSRFDIINVCLIHRVGEFKTKDNIVFVAVSSKHRGEAFKACEFIIDVLKTQAPFWKKEGNKWVEAKNEDTQKTNFWLN